jgi:hypothetical protein
MFAVTRRSHLSKGSDSSRCESSAQRDTNACGTGPVDAAECYRASHVISHEAMLYADLADTSPSWIAGAVRCRTDACTLRGASVEADKNEERKEVWR